MASAEVDLDAAGRPHATPSLLATPAIPITLHNLRQYLEEIVAVGEKMPTVQVCGARWALGVGLSSRLGLRVLCANGLSLGRGSGCGGGVREACAISFPA